MKILLTGGGTGGHFYPIIAVAEELNNLIREEKIIDAKIYFMAPNPYNEGLLFDNNIIFKRSFAGKMRVYFSLLNIVDIFKTGIGILKAIWDLFMIYPDVVFSKGGYGSFPTLFAARFLMIPVVIHESDSVPGRVNKWAGKFAKRIALSYPEASVYFKTEKVAVTGQPIRKELVSPLRTGAREFLKLEENIPVIFITCGSQGSVLINETLIRAVPELIKKYQIIHQVGDLNVEQMNKEANVLFGESEHRDRYKIFGHLNVLAMRMSAGAADIIITRAGSTIFEIASWGVPSIVIPITNSNGNHQRKNAYAYASTGAAIVIEEANLNPNIIISEINRILEDEEIKKNMSQSATNFAKTDAAAKIASEILKIAIPHER